MDDGDNDDNTNVQRPSQPFLGAILMDGLCIVDHGLRFWTPLIKANVKHIIVDPNDDSSVAWKMVNVTSVLTGRKYHVNRNRARPPYEPEDYTIFHYEQNNAKKSCWHYNTNNFSPSELIFSE